MLPPAGPIRMAQGVPKNFRNRVGTLRRRKYPDQAVTTTDISLTVRAYDHAGLGSPPPKLLGVQSGVGMPSPALLLPCNSLLALTTISRAGQITARKPNHPDPEAGSGRARVRDILLTQDAYKIEPGWACRAEPGSGVGDVPPRPGAASSLARCRYDPKARCGWCSGSCCGGGGSKTL